MPKLTVEIKKIVVIRRTTGTDKINIEFDGPTPYPELDALSWKPGQYPPYLEVSTRNGYAKEWLDEMGIKLDKIDFKIIDGDTGEELAL